MIFLYNIAMTMTPNTKALESLSNAIMNATRPQSRIVPSTTDLDRMFMSIMSLASSLDVPRDRLPQLLINAHDGLTLTDYPYADHLVVLYAMTIFALYYISDDTFDDLMSAVLPE